MVRNWTPYGFNCAQYFYLDLYAGQDVLFVRCLVKNFCSAKVNHYYIDTFSDVKKMNKFNKNIFGDDFYFGRFAIFFVCQIMTNNKFLFDTAIFWVFFFFIR